MTIYLDASVLVPIFFDEPTSPLVDRFVKSLDQPRMVSAFALGEVFSAVSRLVRMGQVPVEVALVRLSDLDLWCEQRAQTFETEASDIRLAARFVRRMTLNLRMPDAIHLATVARQGLTLATLDRRLADAARSLDLRVVVPE